MYRAGTRRYVGRIAFAFVLLAMTGCGGTYGWTGAPAPMTDERACSAKAAPHTPAEVVAALRRHGINASARSGLCEDGQRPVTGLHGDGLAGEEDAVYCSVAATPSAQRAQRFHDQVRQDNVFCVTHSARVHKRVVAALRELPR
jgi:hypothetical protein